MAVTSAYVSDVAGGNQLLRRARLTNSLLGLVSCDSAYPKAWPAEWAACGYGIDIKNPSRHQFIPVYPR